MGDAYILTGRIYDERGNRMTPSTAMKHGARYRYYVSAPLLQGRKEDAAPLARVPGPELEAAVVQALRERDTDPISGADRGIVERDLERVVVRSAALDITLKGPQGAIETIQVSWNRPPARPKRQVISAAEGAGVARPNRAETRARLVEGIARARLWLDEIVSGRLSDTAALAKREGVSERSVRMTLNLAFLAPDLVKAAIEGTLPAHAGLSSMTDLPASWARQAEGMTTAVQSGTGETTVTNMTRCHLTEAPACYAPYPSS